MLWHSFVVAVRCFLRNVVACWLVFVAAFVYGCLLCSAIRMRCYYLFDVGGVLRFVVVSCSVFLLIVLVVAYVSC